MSILIQAIRLAALEFDRHGSPKEITLTRTELTAIIVRVLATVKR